MRILIVEDDHKICNAIKKGLEQEKFACDTAYDGKEGLGQAMTLDYDLIILDRMLPETDGLNICKALREHKKHMPILILTARDKIEDRVDGLNSGADDYLVKPFAFEELLARVRALLRRPKENIEEELKIEDLSLNLRTFEVKRQNKKINLSSKEFSLLEFLMRNKNQILTKNNIISHVWNYDADILPNTVEVFIGYLRKKIDRKSKNLSPLIHTVRGFGYRIGKE